MTIRQKKRTFTKKATDSYNDDSDDSLKEGI
jgi:hypothetical protein